MSNHAASTFKTEALSRALATLWQGFGIDVLVMIGTALAVLLGQLEPTDPAFWVALGGIVLKSVLTAAATYFVRMKLQKVEPVNTPAFSTVG